MFFSYEIICALSKIINCSLEKLILGSNYFIRKTNIRFPKPTTSLKHKKQNQCFKSFVSLEPEPGWQNFWNTFFFYEQLRSSLGARLRRLQRRGPKQLAWHQERMSEIQEQHYWEMKRIDLEHAKAMSKFQGWVQFEWANSTFRLFDCLLTKITGEHKHKHIAGLKVCP